MRLILCYHALADDRVSEPDRAGVLTGLANAVQQSQFAAQLNWLNTHADVLTLEELISGSERGEKATKVAITFDDGYRSVIRLGLPLLRGKQFPATWFITSAFTQSRHNLPWWDLLVRFLAMVPGKTSLTIGRAVQDFELGERCGRKVFQERMNQIFYGTDDRLKGQVIEQLISKAEEDSFDVVNDIANADELSGALEEGYLELGGHSSTHLNMGVSTSDRMNEEVKENRAFVAEIAGKPPEWFAYPYGGKKHISKPAVQVVRSSGYRGAVTASARHFSSSDDPFMIPRITVQPGWDMKKFVLSVKAPILAGYVAKGLAALRYRPC